MSIIERFRRRVPTAEQVAKQGFVEAFMDGEFKAAETNLRKFLDVARDRINRNAVAYLSGALLRDGDADKVSFFRGYLACLSDVSSEARRELLYRASKAKEG